MSGITGKDESGPQIPFFMIKSGRTELLEQLAVGAELMGQEATWGAFPGQLHHEIREEKRQV